MAKKEIDANAFFRTCDTDNDGLITMKEFEESMKIFSDFKIKEVHSVHNFFDIDNNGTID